MRTLESRQLAQRSQAQAQAQVEPPPPKRRRAGEAEVVVVEEAEEEEAALPPPPPPPPRVRRHGGGIAGSLAARPAMPPPPRAASRGHISDDLQEVTHAASPPTSPRRAGAGMPLSPRSRIALSDGLRAELARAAEASLAARRAAIAGEAAAGGPRQADLPALYQGVRALRADRAQGEAGGDGWTRATVSSVRQHASASVLDPAFAAAAAATAAGLAGGLLWPARPPAHDLGGPRARRPARADLAGDEPAAVWPVAGRFGS